MWDVKETTKTSIPCLKIQVIQHSKIRQVIIKSEQRKRLNYKNLHVQERTHSPKLVYILLRKQQSNNYI